MIPKRTTGSRIVYWSMKRRTYGFMPERPSFRQKVSLPSMNNNNKNSSFSLQVRHPSRLYITHNHTITITTTTGHKLGTFCVEGPDPRPGGLNEQEQEKLKEYATKAMQLMVERRKNLRDRLTHQNVTDEARQHACVTTNLGDILYTFGDYMTAMRLFQESVQTIMHVEETTTTTTTTAADNNAAAAAKKPDQERQQAMHQLLTLLSVEKIPGESRQALLQKVASFYQQDDKAAAPKKPTVVVDGIPGLFNVNSKLILQGNQPRPLPGLIFPEVFKIKLSTTEQDNLSKLTGSLQELPFTVPPAECSKATLFNMGQIHYHWGSPDMALQFFHLAASVSHQLAPADFDPIDLGCVNNMAQIHLQYRKPDDAMNMLTQALQRGNETLAALYGQSETPQDEDLPAMMSSEVVDARRTKRLRRKLARTVLMMGHCHYYNNNTEAALASCGDALGLLADHPDSPEVAAIWHNMAVLLYSRPDKKTEALTYLDKYLKFAVQFNGPVHLQNADGFLRKGQMLWETGKFAEALEPLTEALKIRRLQLGKTDASVAECLLLMGKVHLALQDYNAALTSLQECLDMQRKLLNGGDLTFEVAQTLLELGRTYHAMGDLQAALEVYTEVVNWTRKFFGVQHSFTARIEAIIASIKPQEK